MSPIPMTPTPNGSMSSGHCVSRRGRPGWAGRCRGRPLEVVVAAARTRAGSARWARSPRTPRWRGRRARTPARSPGSARGARRRSPARPGRRSAAAGSIPLPLNRTCHVCGHRQHDVPAHELGPVEAVAVGGRQQAGPVAALLVDPVGPLEHRDPGPVGGVRVEGDVVALDDDLHPVVEPSDHQRAHRAEAARVAAGRLVPTEAAIDGLPDGDRLGHREGDRRVDHDAPRRRLLEPLEAGRRGRELHLDVRGERGEVEGLLGHPGRIAVLGRVGLEREAALAAVLASKTGARIPAPRTPISSISAQVTSTSDQVGCSIASSRTRGTQWSFSFFMTSPTMTGFEVAPVPPRATA